MLYLDVLTGRKFAQIRQKTKQVLSSSQARNDFERLKKGQRKWENRTYTV